MTKLAKLSPGNSLTYQHNMLIHQPINMSSLETKIFLLALRCVHKTDEELPPISIPLTDIMPKLNGGKDYFEIASACEKLLNRNVQQVPLTEKGFSKTKKWRGINIFQELAIDANGSGKVTGLFTDSIKPYILQLNGNYTWGEIATLLTISNPNTHRLYWILKSYYKGECELGLDELRMLLFENETQYVTFADFKRYVLDVAVKTFASLDWEVSYKALKCGKKVDRIKFTMSLIQSEKKIKQAIEQPQLSLPMQSAEIDFPQQPEQFNKVYKALKSVWSFEMWQIKLVAEYIDSNDLKLEKVRDTMRVINVEKTKFDNPAAVLWVTLKKNLPALEKLHKERFPKK